MFQIPLFILVIFLNQSFCCQKIIFISFIYCAKLKDVLDVNVMGFALHVSIPLRCFKTIQQDVPISEFESMQYAFPVVLRIVFIGGITRMAGFPAVRNSTVILSA